MSRQLDLKAEERTRKREHALFSVLEYDLAGVIEFQGGKLRGFAMTYDEFSCGMVYKAEWEGIKKVAFVYSDSMTNVLLRAVNLAKNNRLRWKEDVYAPANA